MGFVKFIKFLFLIYEIFLYLSPVGADNGICERIISNECPYFNIINAKVSQSVFDTNVREKYIELKRLLSAGNPDCENDIYSKARYLKSISCNFVINDQKCPGSNYICPDICMELLISIKNITCINTSVKASLNAQCSLKAIQSNKCLSYNNTELDTCGFEDVNSKIDFCARNPNYNCCNNINELSSSSPGLSLGIIGCVIVILIGIFVNLILIKKRKSEQNNKSD